VIDKPGDFSAMSSARHRHARSTTPSTRTRRGILAAAGISVTAGTLMVLAATGASATPTKNDPPAGDKITICHATASTHNPYNVIDIDVAGAYDGHLGHTGPVFSPDLDKHVQWGDIIPPTSYNGQDFSLNWDAAGQAIWNNDCALPVATPTVTETATATETKTETATVTQTATETQTKTETATATVTETAPGETVTVTAPPSTDTVTVTAPPSTVTETATQTATETQTVTETATTTAPGATETVTAPASTVTETATTTAPAETETVTAPASTVTETETQTVTAPASSSAAASSSSDGTSAAASSSADFSGASSSRASDPSDSGGAGVAGESAGPIPAAADAGLHAPATVRSGLAIWGSLLILAGGVGGLFAGVRPRRGSRGH